MSTREIDLCAGIAKFFGPSAHLAAQAVKDVDVVVDGPTLRLEVKYLRSRSNWSEVLEDWNWLLAASNAGDEFRKRFFVAFFPSVSRFTLQKCVAITGLSRPPRPEEYLPLVPFVTLGRYANGSPRLDFASSAPRSCVIQTPSSGAGPRKCVRVDMVGAMDHPIWAAIYSRVVGTTDVDEKITVIPVGL